MDFGPAEFESDRSSFNLLHMKSEERKASAEKAVIAKQTREIFQRIGEFHLDVLDTDF